MKNFQRIMFLRENWGFETVDRLLASICVDKVKEMTMDEFLNHCTIYGDNWDEMLLTGIKKLWPTVWGRFLMQWGIMLGLACVL